MATLYVTEYTDLALVAGHQLQVAKTPPVAEQTVAIGGSSTASAVAFTAETRFIRVHTDAICSIAIGKAPTASATTARLAADQSEYFGVEPGHKIAVITNS